MEKKQNGGIYFAAMNTGDGFKSYFNEIFGSLKRLYIIKGGPGTGKSRFMKDVYSYAESKGHIAERYLCSSDPTSLDGVIIPSLSLGIIDGTAPHTYEPLLTGAKDNIIDLGRFWRVRDLESSIDLITEVSRRKSRLYCEIYSYLNAVKSIDSIIDGSVNEAVNTERLTQLAKKYTALLKKGIGINRNVKIRSAISDSGLITLNTYAKTAKKRFAVVDTCGRAGGHFLSELLKESAKNGLSYNVSFSPFSPTLPDAIYYPESDIAFYIGSESDFTEETINTRRFINDGALRPYKPKIRALTKLRKDILNNMFIEFSSVKKLHGELEQIYGNAMDFEAKEKYTEDFLSTVFE